MELKVTILSIGSIEILSRILGTPILVDRSCPHVPSKR